MPAESPFPFQIFLLFSSQLLFTLKIDEVAFYKAPFSIITLLDGTYILNLFIISHFVFYSNILSLDLSKGIFLILLAVNDYSKQNFEQADALR